MNILFILILKMSHSQDAYVPIMQDFRVLILGGVLVLAPSTLHLVLVSGPTSQEHGSILSGSRCPCWKCDSFLMQLTRKLAYCFHDF